MRILFTLALLLCATTVFAASQDSNNDAIMAELDKIDTLLSHFDSSSSSSSSSSTTSESSTSNTGIVQNEDGTQTGLSFAPGVTEDDSSSTSADDSVVSTAVDAGPVSRAGALPSGTSADCSTTWVVLLTLTVFFAGAALTLATAAIMVYRLAHTPVSGAEGYKSLDKEGFPHGSLSPAQRIVLLVMAIATIAATVTVGVYFGVQLSSVAPAAAGAGGSTVARAVIVSTLSSVATNGHNTRRKSVKSTIPNLTWSATDASVAQAYISKCPGLVHNPNRGNRGENIYVSSAAGIAGDQALSQAMAAWWAEKSYYNYATNGCAAGKMCGHYTQMVWATTRTLGCAVNNNCPGTWKTQVVCDYSPPGNYIGRKPY